MHALHTTIGFVLKPNRLLTRSAVSPRYKSLSSTFPSCSIAPFVELKIKIVRLSDTSTPDTSIAFLADLKTRSSKFDESKEAMNPSGIPSVIGV